MSFDPDPKAIPEIIAPTPKLSGVTAHDESDDNNSESDLIMSEYIDPTKILHLATYQSVHNKNQLSGDEWSEACIKERSSWIDKIAFKRVPKRGVPTDANVIVSHIIYKRKANGTPKVRIVPWGHKDLENDNLRGDAPSPNLGCLRLLIYLDLEQGWKVRKMDVKAAYLLAKWFNRIIYLRPLREENDPYGLWLLLEAAYGLAEYGRLWYFT